MTTPMSSCVMCGKAVIRGDLFCSGACRNNKKALDDARDPPNHTPEHFAQIVTEECAALANMLIAKNEQYGDSALNPVRIFSRAPTEEQLLVRIDDKLSRLARGNGGGDEDVVKDLVGYLILLRIARRKAAP